MQNIRVFVGLIDGIFVARYGSQLLFQHHIAFAYLQSYFHYTHVLFFSLTRFVASSQVWRIWKWKRLKCAIQKMREKPQKEKGNCSRWRKVAIYVIIPKQNKRKLLEKRKTCIYKQKKQTKSCTGNCNDNGNGIRK